MENTGREQGIEGEGGDFGEGIAEYREIGVEDGCRYSGFAAGRRCCHESYAFGEFWMNLNEFLTATAPLSFMTNLNLIMA